MIKYNKLNQIAAEKMILWNHLGGWECFENDSVESEYMGDSLESDLRDKSDVNETADL